MANGDAQRPTPASTANKKEACMISDGMVKQALIH